MDRSCLRNYHSRHFLGNTTLKRGKTFVKKTSFFNNVLLFAWVSFRENYVREWVVYLVTLKNIKYVLLFKYVILSINRERLYVETQDYLDQLESQDSLEVLELQAPRTSRATRTTRSQWTRKINRASCYWWWWLIWWVWWDTGRWWEGRKRWYRTQRSPGDTWRAWTCWTKRYARRARCQRTTGRFRPYGTTRSSRLVILTAFLKDMLILGLFFLRLDGDLTFKCWNC